MKTHYSSLTEARARLKDVLDAAEAGLPLHIERQNVGFAVMKESVLADILTGGLRLPQPPELYQENDGWSIVLHGTPVAADSTSFDEAVDDFMDALREYAEDWIADEGLQWAPSHRDSRALVWLVRLLPDEKLRAWVLRAGEPANVKELARKAEPLA